METGESRGLEYRVIDRYCTFNYLLSYIDKDFRISEGKCFCPFHDNHDTPAAKLYQEETGEYIFCFTEGRKYYPHHLLTKEIVPFTVNHVFSSIWTQLSDFEKSQFDEYHKDKYDIDFSFYYDQYKRGLISLEDIYSYMKES